MGYGFEGRVHSLMGIVVHITVTEASGGPGFGLGTQVLPLICWHQHVVGKLEDTHNGKRNVLYLASTLTNQHQ